MEGPPDSKHKVPEVESTRRSTAATFLVAFLVLVIVSLFLLSSWGTLVIGANGSISATGPSTTITTSTKAMPAAGDWPTYLQNPTRTSANLAESTLSSASVKKIKELWSYNTGDVISGSTTVVGNTAYVGSWNGEEYALNTSTGALLWHAFLGNSTSPKCGNTGLAGSATVANDTLYIGGGDGYWYVLNATTGSIEWKVLVGPPSQGFFNWASPLVYGGFAYVGVASYCDMPLVPGGLLQVNLTSHEIQNEFRTTPAGVLGSSVWGSPSIDLKTQTVFFTTGNNYPKQPGEFADAVVAVQAANVSNLVSSWTIPASKQVVDGDFGSSPTLFTTSAGVTLMGALDKNGYFYAFNASDLAAGPLWADKITTGQSVGSAAFGQGLVYVAAGTADYKGIRSSGAAWALNPATGAVVWEQTLWAKSVSAPAYANGILVVDAGKHLFILNATTGSKLKEPPCTSTFYSPPAIAHGKIFVGCTNGQEFAFGIPGSSASGIRLQTESTLTPEISSNLVGNLALLPRWA